MKFIYYGENPLGDELDSDLLMFDKRQKAYVTLLEDTIARKQSVIQFLLKYIRKERRRNGTNI